MHYGPGPSSTPDHGTDSGQLTPLPAPVRRADPPVAARGHRQERHELVDTFGRVAKDLRVSLTDHCNLRCTYCMPAEGLPWMKTSQMLTDDEFVRLVGVFTSLGVEKIRLTGGEPTLRPGLVELVARFAAITPRPEIAMTTNGIGLDRLAGPLAEAGLNRVNVSLDSVDPEVFRALTRRARFDDVVAGMDAAAAAGLTPVKVNAVAMRQNEDGIPDLLDWCLERGFELRFIEQMPLDAQHEWKRTTMVSAEEVHALLSQRHTLTPCHPKERGSAPAELFLVDGGPATVGIIASVTSPFCAGCDRVRLTADGMVRNCLFSRGEVDLRGPMRSGATDEDLVRLIRGEMWRKARGHGIGEPDFTQPTRPMSAIGG